MHSDQESTLETDHLEELLEKPAASQSVVVVQYRNRGVPTWLFFPFVILVPAVSLFAYHRLVVEKERVQAARDRSLLARQIEAERAQLPLVRDNSPSTTVLPVPTARSTEGENNEVRAASVSPAEQGLKAPLALNMPKSGADAGSSPSPSPAVQSVVSATAPFDPVGQKDTQSNATAPVAPADNGITLSRENDPAPNGQPAVASPSAKLDAPSKPLATNETPGAPSDLAQAEKELPDDLGGPVNKPFRDTNEGRLPAITADHSRPATPASVPGGLNPAAGPRNDGPRENENVSRPDARIAGRVGRSEPAPLPTKEEMERSIAEEASKKEADRVSQLMNRVADLRARRYEEQVKFREELRELLRTKGNRAGVDIEKLHKRYAYDIDEDRDARAFRAWQFSRTPVSDRVKNLRSLGIPETRILEFMCASLDKRIRTRDGPRDQNEVWVWAARQLLRSEPPGSAGAGVARLRPPTVPSPSGKR